MELGHKNTSDTSLVQCTVIQLRERERERYLAWPYLQDTLTMSNFSHITGYQNLCLKPESMEILNMHI